MKSYQKKKLDKLLIENQLEMLKNTKADPNNIILNAAAFQQDLVKEMGYFKKNLNFKKKIKDQNRQKQTENILDGVGNDNYNNNNEDKIAVFLPKIINKTINDEKDSQVILRRKVFLSGLSLAQKIGLKQIPKMPLSLQEWRNIEAKTVSRSDHTSSCPICLEALAKRETMILSCSHIFHKNCILNFEKLSNSKKCPMCRCTNYEKKEYIKDKEFYINRCILLLQKYIRGFLLRYFLYKTVFKNNMPKNKNLRKIYSTWKIKELTKNIANAIEKKNTSVNNLIKKIESEDKKFLALNREIEKKTKKLGLEHLMNDDPWLKVLNEIKKRDDVCAICFAPMFNKQVYLTDCSHCFHKNCLESFERFDNYYAKRCPCCRQNYEKKLIKLI